MKLRIREGVKKLGSDMFITDYARDIVKLLVNKPKPYRFLYDAQADIYMICDAWDHIHSDMVVTAFENGWYIDQKDFVRFSLDFIIVDWVLIILQVVWIIRHLKKKSMKMKNYLS